MTAALNFNNKWLNTGDKPLLIAGPCSAESEEQVLAIAQGIKAVKPVYFRAGIWKPRTRPGAFEGVGAVGLKWMQQVKAQTGLKTIVEAANANHVELCLEHGIDALWIGARTTVNPFTVQEIADALKGVDIPVIIKNPVNPDLNLWIGAIERIYHAGITKIAAIHRGFSSFDKNKYRNKPMWEIPIELRRLYPELIVFCDPSHISGKRALLYQVSQMAMDMNFDGLMIETHNQPDKAFSDSEQQVTPEGLKKLLDKLIIRQTGTDDINFNATIEELREIIDKNDEELIKLLQERMSIVENIGLLKNEKNITILQPERWNDIYESRVKWANEAGLSEELTLRIFQLIHQNSIKRQTDVMNKAVEKEVD